MSADDLKRAVEAADKFDVGIVVIGIVTFLLSFFPYYSYSAGFAGVSASTTYSAWHGFFGWFAAMLALAAACLITIHLLGLKVLEDSLMRMLVLGAFAVALLCVILALFIVPGAVDCGGIKECEDAINEGHSFGYWVTGILLIGGTVLAFLRKDATD